MKKTLGRLVEAYADAKDLRVEGRGAETLRQPMAERGAEPDRLEGQAYVAREESELLPGMTRTLVTELLELGNQTDAVRGLQRVLESAS
ncbi:MAG: hypothetical protein AAFX94_25995 [Myxococcota bacterium]